MTERTACVTVDGGSARHKVLHRLTHGCRPQIHGKVACWNRRLSEVLTDRNRSNTRCVDGDPRNTPQHRLHQEAKTYTLTGMTRQLRPTAERSGAWRGMIAAVALMTAWVSPAALATAPLADSFRVAGVPFSDYIIPDTGGSGHTYNLGGGLTSRSADGDGISNFAYLNGNNNTQVGNNVVVVPWFIKSNNIHDDHSGNASGNQNINTPGGDNWEFTRSPSNCSTNGRITDDIVSETCGIDMRPDIFSGASGPFPIARQVRNPRLDVTVTVYDADGQAFTARCRRNNSSPQSYIERGGADSLLRPTRTTVQNDARCHTPQAVVNTYNAGNIGTSLLHPDFNAPMYTKGNPDTASYTYTGSINNETVTTRRRCSVNVVGTPGPNTPCPDGTNPVLYPESGHPTGGWRPLDMSAIISPTTLEASYDRHVGSGNSAVNYRTAISRAFPTFASFLAAWNAGDNDWHNPFTGGFTTIPGPGRAVTSGRNLT